jgi:hypothetical protein
MTTNFCTALKNARSQAIITAVNAGTGTGTINFYTAARPAAGAVITDQVLLGTVTCAEPAGTVSNGVLTFSSITDDSLADATGAAAWVRVLDGSGVWVVDMDVTDDTGAGPVKMPSTQIYAGGIVHFSSLVITEGN